MPNTPVLNDLDPALTLFDPSGVAVASDSNGQDGKNARIVFTATTDGSRRTIP